MSDYVLIAPPPMDIHDRYQAVCERNRELFEAVEQSRMELHRKDEVIRATSIEHIRLRAGLREALDGWLRVTNRGIPSALEQESVTKIAELRKLLGGES